MGEDQLLEFGETPEFLEVLVVNNEIEPHVL